MQKAYEESKSGTTIVLLIPARTDTTYFHDYIYGRAEVRFIRGRIVFVDEAGEPCKEEKGLAVLKIVNMETHNSIRKDDMLKVIRWLLELSFELPEEKP